MSQTEKLTDEDVGYIIGAFDIATGETDGDYSDIKAKLFRMNPKVKIEVADYNERLERASREQDGRRRSITAEVFIDLDLNKPILSQLKNWIKNDSNWKVLRAKYSDEICLSGDLWKYHFGDLKKTSLFSELREHLRIESEKKGNEWMKDKVNRRTDEDLWHELIRHLERARRS